jgi:hypothetical protein
MGISLAIAFAMLRRERNAMAYGDAAIARLLCPGGVAGSGA